MSEATWTPLPPDGAIRFFRRKGLLASFDWRDLEPELHAHAFTVAKMTDMSLLADMHAAVEHAIANGQTLDEFKAAVTPTLQARGWWGRQQVRDPKTGETREVQLGSARRLETIYDTNCRTSYAAGRWEQIQRTKARRPYIRYVAILDERTRPEHRRWHGLVLPVDDPFWQTHFPPNGWRCRCTPQQLSDRDLTRYGYTIGSAPPIVTQRWENPRTGDVRHVPLGIDPGFDQHVGLSLSSPSERAARAFGDKIADVPAAIGAATWAVAESEMLPPLGRAYARWADRVLQSMTAADQAAPELGEVWPVGALSPAAVQALSAIGAEPASALVALRGSELQHMARDAKQLAGTGLPAAELRRIPELLANRRALLWDKRQAGLLAVVDVAGEARLGKLVVRLDFRTKARVATGERVSLTINSVRTAGLVEQRVLADPNTYDVLEGAL